MSTVVFVGGCAGRVVGDAAGLPAPADAGTSESSTTPWPSDEDAANGYYITLPPRPDPSLLTAPVWTSTSDGFGLNVANFAGDCSDPETVYDFDPRTRTLGRLLCPTGGPPATMVVLSPAQVALVTSDLAAIQSQPSSCDQEAWWADLFVTYPDGTDALFTSGGDTPCSEPSPAISKEWMVQFIGILDGLIDDCSDALDAGACVGDGGFPAPPIPIVDSGATSATWPSGATHFTLVETPTFGVIDPLADGTSCIEGAVTYDYGWQALTATTCEYGVTVVLDAKLDEQVLAEARSLHAETVGETCDLHGGSRAVATYTVGETDAGSVTFGGCAQTPGAGGFVDNASLLGFAHYLDSFLTVCIPRDFDAGYSGASCL